MAVRARGEVVLGVGNAGRRGAGSLVGLLLGTKNPRSPDAGRNAERACVYVLVEPWRWSRHPKVPNGGRGGADVCVCGHRRCGHCRSGGAVGVF